MGINFRAVYNWQGNQTENPFSRPSLKYCSRNATYVSLDVVIAVDIEIAHLSVGSPRVVSMVIAVSINSRLFLRRIIFTFVRISIQKRLRLFRKCRFLFHFNENSYMNNRPYNCSARDSPLSNTKHTGFQ